MDITYLAATRGGRTAFYKVKVDGDAVGTVTKDPIRGRWWVYPYASTMRAPVRPFPTRKAAGERLAAASGLWLAKP